MLDAAGVTYEKMPEIEITLTNKWNMF
jgi:hypothetical protein